MKHFVEYIQEEFRDLIKEKYEKTLTEVTSEFYQNKVKRDGPPPELFLGSFTSLKTLVKDGFEEMYYIPGGKDKILLFKSKSNKVLEYFKAYKKGRDNFGGFLLPVEEEEPLIPRPRTDYNQPSIEEFLKIHLEHDLCLKYIPSDAGSSYIINCIKCKTEIDITDYDSW